MLIPSMDMSSIVALASLSRRVNANSQPFDGLDDVVRKLIKKGEC